jgi:hypothetical protein
MVAAPVARKGGVTEAFDSLPGNHEKRNSQSFGQSLSKGAFAMTTKNFVFPANDSTKQEEIEFLTRMVNQVTPGTYLAGLLNARLLDWFSQQARNDFTCDVMEELDCTLAEYDKATAETKEYAKAYQERNAQVEASTRLHLEDIERKNEEIAHLTDILNGVYAERDNAQSENAGLLDDIHELNDQVYDRDQIIVALKAKLYDLMVS